jgi:hypothetical protein
MAALAVWLRLIANPPQCRPSQVSTSAAIRPSVATTAAGCGVSARAAIARERLGRRSGELVGRMANSCPRHDGNAAHTSYAAKLGIFRTEIDVVVRLAQYRRSICSSFRRV